ncbi:MAG: hypothetical protein J0H35_07535 [Rhodospirillales bacterium]|nr:hypothetical protein [Rhodospirillales bacterium]
MAAERLDGVVGLASASPAAQMATPTTTRRRGAPEPSDPDWEPIPSMPAFFERMGLK